MSCLDDDRLRHLGHHGDGRGRLHRDLRHADLQRGADQPHLPVPDRPRQRRGSQRDLRRHAVKSKSAGGILRATATASIIDDDGLAIGNVSITEGSGGGTVTATATVTLTASASTVTVDWGTVDGTATAGSDYTAASGSLTFAPGETSKTIDVTIASDAVWEANEAFRIVLSNAVGAQIVDGSGTVTIGNDDNRTSR